MFNWSPKHGPFSFLSHPLIHSRPTHTFMIFITFFQRSGLIFNLKMQVVLGSKFSGAVKELIDIQREQVQASS
jgi:hypothetical protein